MTAERSATAAVLDTESNGRIVRFDRAERWLHWSMALLVMAMMTTGAVLYFGPLSALVGRRLLMKDIHVISGLLLPFPFLAVLAGHWRGGLRRDVARVTRWTSDDTEWVRSRGVSPKIQLGKFNAGQKLNTLFIAGVLPVMLLSGSVMKWFAPFPDSWRTGATFVHDLGAFALWIAVTGHIYEALREPEAMRSMWSGWVPSKWAQQHRPRWYSQVTGETIE